MSGHWPGSLQMLRLIVASETSTPISSSKASQCSLKVRSGFAFNWAGNHSLKALPFTEGLPGIFIVSTPPVWRLRLSQRLMVEREIPKSSETSILGMPRSMAASAFNLRSFEYAFMESIFTQVRYLRNPLSEAMDEASVEAPDSVKLRKEGTTRSVAAEVTYDGATHVATLNPTQPLEKGTTYVAKVRRTAQDTAGNAVEMKRWTFRITP